MPPASPDRWRPHPITVALVLQQESRSPIWIPGIAVTRVIRFLGQHSMNVCRFPDRDSHKTFSVNKGTIHRLLSKCVYIIICMFCCVFLFSLQNSVIHCCKRYIKNISDFRVSTFITEYYTWVCIQYRSLDSFDCCYMTLYKSQ